MGSQLRVTPRCPEAKVDHHSTQGGLQLVSGQQQPRRLLQRPPAQGANMLVPLLQALITWRTYKEVVIWDYVKAYNTIRTFVEDLHMRRLVWRFSPEDPWTTYGVNRMHFGDRLATTGLEVAKRKVADVRESIDPAAAAMIKKGYSDDGVTGDTKQDVTR